MRNRLFSTLFLSSGAAALLVLAGCSARSISDSGYREEGSYYGRSSGGSYQYRGELAETDVVGAPVTNGNISEADIQRALRGSRQRGTVRAAPGSKLVVVQSGAATPDSEMLRHLGARYRVQAFSGQPPAEGERANYSKSLRLAAAQGGCDRILCYWGTLESAKQDQVTKTVSWVPIAGKLLPDETQQMRINLHAVLIDVSTGHWSTYTGKSSENQALSAGLIREYSDQKQVTQLKAAAYASLAEELAIRGT